MSERNIPDNSPERPFLLRLKDLKAEWPLAQQYSRRTIYRLAQVSHTVLLPQTAGASPEARY